MESTDFGQLLVRAKQYALNFIQNNKEEAYCFHNSKHTSDVVHAAEQMVSYYKLNEEDKFSVLCAAYFHDLGYCSGGAYGHEHRSADLVLDFLKSENISTEIQDKVSGCILATKIPQSPRNLLEEILCDADLYHLGNDSFDDRNKLMHQEAEKVAKFKIAKNVWREITIEFLKNHQYHTEFARINLDAGKKENIATLEKTQRKYLAKNNKTDKDKVPERGIETMFRVSLSNSQRLSDMADNKANILLTVNSIILSVVVAMLVQKLDKNQHLIIPTVLLLIAVVVTMVIAILSTIPKIKNGRFQQQDVANKNVNLLFFGNFYRMPFDTYDGAMKEAMNDYEFLYSMLTRDVYGQGVVLGRKYKLLRYAYAVFMIGLIVSVFAFLVAIILVS